MSSSDLLIRDVITNYGLVLFAIIAIIFLMTRRWSNLRMKIYRDHLIGFEAECAELALPYKKHLFESLPSIVSGDEVLRSMGCIRILEIGVKTGENIQFYPEGTHLIGADLNIKLGEYLMKGNRSWQFSHVIIEKLLIGDGSSMNDVPTGYVDVVVTTRSLCSVTSMSSTLREIRRVLTPGGRYYFMEHVPETEGALIKWLQKILSRTGIWSSFFGGCRLDINPKEEIENAGFEQVTTTPVTLEGYVSNWFRLLFTRQHVFGVAIR